MIGQIRLQNFQSHSDTTLNLHPGINAISGDSDKGKSAVVRGLLWAIENHPQGDAHVSDWIKTDKGTIKAGQECRVTVSTAKGEVARIRSAKMNGYTLGTQVMEAVRADVPEEVGAFFNLGEVNVQRQLDRPFLISYPSGEAARFLNRLVNLTDIDAALTDIDGKKRRSKQQVTDLAERALKLGEELKAYEWLPTARGLVTASEARQAQITALAQRIANTKVDTLNWTALQSQRKAYEPILAGIGEGLAKALKTDGQIRGLSPRYTLLQSTYTARCTAEMTHRRLAPCLSTAGAKAQELSDIVPRLLSLRQSLDRMAPTIPEYNQCVKLSGARKGIVVVAGLFAALPPDRPELRNQVVAIQTSLYQWKAAEVVDLKQRPWVTEAGGLLPRVERTARVIETMAGNLRQLRILHEDYQKAIQTRATFTAVVAERKAALDTAIEASAWCPTCGQPWPEGHSHE